MGKDNRRFSGETVSAAKRAVTAQRGSGTTPTFRLMPCSVAATSASERPFDRSPASIAATSGMALVKLATCFHLAVLKYASFDRFSSDSAWEKQNRARRLPTRQGTANQRQAFTTRPSSGQTHRSAAMLMLMLMLCKAQVQARTRLRVMQPLKRVQARRPLGLMSLFRRGDAHVAHCALDFPSMRAVLPSQGGNLCT